MDNANRCLLDIDLLARVFSQLLSVQDICNASSVCVSWRAAAKQGAFALRLVFPYSRNSILSLAQLPFPFKQILVGCTRMHASCEPEYVGIWQKALSALMAFEHSPQGHVESVCVWLPWRPKILGYLASGVPSCVKHLNIRCAGGLKCYSPASSSKRQRSALPGLMLGQQPHGSGLSFLAQLPNLRALDVDVVLGSDISEVAVITALTSLHLRLRDMPAISGCAGRDEGGLPHLRLHTHSLTPLSALAHLKSLSISVEGLDSILQDSKPASYPSTRPHRVSAPMTATPASSVQWCGGSGMGGGALSESAGGKAVVEGIGEADAGAGVLSAGAGVCGVKSGDSEKEGGGEVGKPCLCGPRALGGPKGGGEATAAATATAREGRGVGTEQGGVTVRTGHVRRMAEPVRCLGGQPAREGEGDAGMAEPVQAAAVMSAAHSMVDEELGFVLPHNTLLAATPAAAAVASPRAHHTHEADAEGVTAAAKTAGAALEALPDSTPVPSTSPLKHGPATLAENTDAAGSAAVQEALPGAPSDAPAPKQAPSTAAGTSTSTAAAKGPATEAGSAGAGMPAAQKATVTGSAEAGMPAAQKATETARIPECLLVAPATSNPHVQTSAAAGPKDLTTTSASKQQGGQGRVHSVSAPLTSVAATTTTPKQGHTHKPCGARVGWASSVCSQSTSRGGAASTAGVTGGGVSGGTSALSAFEDDSSSKGPMPKSAARLLHLSMLAAIPLSALPCLEALHVNGCGVGRRLLGELVGSRARRHQRKRRRRSSDLGSSGGWHSSSAGKHSVLNQSDQSLSGSQHQRQQSAPSDHGVSLQYHQHSSKHDIWQQQLQGSLRPREQQQQQQQQQSEELLQGIPQHQDSEQRQSERTKSGGGCSSSDEARSYGSSSSSSTSTCSSSGTSGEVCKEGCMVRWQDQEWGQRKPNPAASRSHLSGIDKAEEVCKERCMVRWHDQEAAQLEGGHTSPLPSQPQPGSIAQVDVCKERCVVRWHDQEVRQSKSPPARSHPPRGSSTTSSAKLGEHTVQKAADQGLRSVMTSASGHPSSTAFAGASSPTTTTSTTVSDPAAFRAELARRRASTSTAIAPSCVRFAPIPKDVSAEPEQIAAPAQQCPSTSTAAAGSACLPIASTPEDVSAQAAQACAPRSTCTSTALAGAASATAQPSSEHRPAALAVCTAAHPADNSPWDPQEEIGQAASSVDLQADVVCAGLLSEGSDAGCMSEVDSGLDKEDAAKVGASRTSSSLPDAHEQPHAGHESGQQHLPLGPLPPSLHRVQLGLVVRPGAKARRGSAAAAATGEAGREAAANKGSLVSAAKKAAGPGCLSDSVAWLLQQHEQDEDADMWEVCAVARQVCSHEMQEQEVRVHVLAPTNSSLRKLWGSSSGQGLRNVAVSRQTSVTFG